MNYQKADNYIWSVKLYLMKKYGCSQAERDIYPLSWYIGTGRASMNFLHKLASAKPFMIARKLHEGGSHDDAIKRVMQYIGYNTDI